MKEARLSAPIYGSGFNNYYLFAFVIRVSSTALTDTDLCLLSSPFAMRNMRGVKALGSGRAFDYSFASVESVSPGMLVTRSNVYEDFERRSIRCTLAANRTVRDRVNGENPEGTGLADRSAKARTRTDGLCSHFNHDPSVACHIPTGVLFPKPMSLYEYAWVVWAAKNNPLLSVK